MTLSEMRDLLKFTIGFNDSQSDGPISDERSNQLLNAAAIREWIDCWQNGSKKHMLAYGEFTWSEGEDTFELPESLRDKMLYRFYDVTSGTGKGTRLQIPWETSNTLRWGSQGPSGDRTIRAFYVARPEKMVDDEDTVTVIPSDFHELFVWSAACHFKRVADGSVPNDFREELQEWRMRLYKAMAARPLGDIATIAPADVELDWLQPFS